MYAEQSWLKGYLVSTPSPYACTLQHECMLWDSCTSLVNGFVV